MNRKADQTTPEAPAVSDNQAADFAALEATAADLDAGAPGAPEPEPEAPPVDLAGELSGLIAVAVGIAAPMYPTVAAIYTEGTIAAAAGAVARVCQKHGWLQAGVAGKWSEEIAAAAILIPLGMATANAIRADNAARQAEEKKKRVSDGWRPMDKPTGGGFDAALGKTAEELAAEKSA